MWRGALSSSKLPGLLLLLSMPMQVPIRHEEYVLGGDEQPISKGGGKERGAVPAFVTLRVFLAGDKPTHTPSPFSQLLQHAGGWVRVRGCAACGMAAFTHCPF